MLIASEKSNGVLANRGSQTRETRSNCRSGITSTPHPTPSPRRCPSPDGSRTANNTAASLRKRAQSAERKKPSTPTRPLTPSSPLSMPSTPPSSTSSRSTTPVRDIAVDMRNAPRRLVSSRTDGLWPSVRSLSTSFQAECISIPARKRDNVIRSSSLDQTSKSVANIVSERKRSPLRGKNLSDKSENSKPVDYSLAKMIDHHRWPGKISANALSRSMDLTDKVRRTASSPYQTRGISPARRSPISNGKDTSTSIHTRGLSPTRNLLMCDVAGRGPPKSSAKLGRHVSLDGTGREQCELGLGSNVFLKQSETSTLVSRASRTQSPPIPRLNQPSSPSKVLSVSTSSSKTAPSPSRTRPSSPLSSSSSANNRVRVSSSFMAHTVDERKARNFPEQIGDTHQLRMLFNRDLQWRFANARADDASLAQKVAAENILYTVWNFNSELRDFVVMKRIDVEHLRQALKLDIILKDQKKYLEDWILLESEHSSSLMEAIETLKTSTLCLPITGRATADVRAVKNAVSSAVDVMQAMGSSICYLLSRVECTNRLVSELSEAATKGRAMLDECRELLASIAAMQVQEISLRTHLIELRQEIQLTK